MSKLRLLLAAVAALTLILVGGVQHQPATAFTGDSQRPQPNNNARIYAASAWGSQVTGLSGIVNLGRTAHTALDCTQRLDLNRTNSIASVGIPGLADVGAINSWSTTDLTNGVESSTGRSEIAGASLLGGAVEIGAISAEAKASRSASGQYSGTTSTQVASITVLGQDVEITGGPQTINVPGLATIILDTKQVEATANGVDSVAAAVRVRVLETGATIRLGDARASINGSGVQGLFRGQSYGSRLTLGDSVQSGPTAALTAPCLGTGGQPVTAQVAGVNLGAVGSVGAVQSTVNTSTSPRYEMEASNEIASASLLAGLASLNGISSSVQVWRNADGSLGYETEAGVASISVAGINIDVPTTPGGTVGLPGVGTLTFHDVEIINSGNGVAVTAVKIQLLGGQVLELGRSAGVILPVR